MWNRALWLTAATSICVLAGCGKKDNAASNDSAAAAAGNTAAARTGAGASATASANATTSATLTDPNIAYILDQASISDSARGRLAETKGTSADVKSFGKLMVGEHHMLHQQGQQLEKKLNVTPQAPANDQSESMAKTEMDSLNAMPKGKAWDKAYIDYEVNFHQQVIDTANKALDAAQNQELKDLIKKAAPVLQKHLDRAKQIQQKLGTAT